MVTCLYRGVPGPTLGSRVESVGISTDFSGGVLAARFIENGIQFGLGSTLAFRRRELQSIGGFESCLDYLADDYELGNRIHALGFKILLAPVAVDTFLPAYDWTAFFRHQLRWARSVRDARRWGYLGVLFTFGLPWAMLNAFAHPHLRWTWLALAVVLAVRLLMAISVGAGVIRDRFTIRLLWLVPLRDVVALLVWFASFAGNQVAWRGDSFALKDGKLARISP
jgi:ceramide glucosyltransferase